MTTAESVLDTSQVAESEAAVRPFFNVYETSRNLWALNGDLMSGDGVHIVSQLAGDEAAPGYSAETLVFDSHQHATGQYGWQLIQAHAGGRTIRNLVVTPFTTNAYIYELDQAGLVKHEAEIQGEELELLTEIFYGHITGKAVREYTNARRERRYHAEQHLADVASNGTITTEMKLVPGDADSTIRRIVKLKPNAYQKEVKRLTEQAEGVTYLSTTWFAPADRHRTVQGQLVYYLQDNGLDNVIKVRYE